MCKHQKRLDLHLRMHYSVFIRVLKEQLHLAFLFSWSAKYSTSKCPPSLPRGPMGKADLSPPLNSGLPLASGVALGEVLNLLCLCVLPVIEAHY